MSKIKYPITRKELERIFLVDKDVLRGWIRDIVGINHSGKFTPLDVELIRQRLGDPSEVS